MAHPHEVKLTDPKGVIHWRSLGYGYREVPDDLGEFWEAVESLPAIDGKDYRKIIKKLFKQNGEPDFDSYEKLTLKLEKKGDKKDEEAFQEWHTTMKVIRVQVAQQIHMNRLKGARDERKQQIKTRKEQARIERESRRSAAELVALAAIESASTVELANAELRRPKPRAGRATSPEGVGAEEV